VESRKRQETTVPRFTLILAGVKSMSFALIVREPAGAVSRSEPVAPAPKPNEDSRAKTPIFRANLIHRYGALVPRSDQVAWKLACWNYSDA